MNESDDNTKISIILVNPQMGENIGAVARSMKNFALYDLRLVSPRDGWPNDKAISTSVGASNLVQNAKLYNNITDAISDLEYVYATTAARRDMNKQYILSSNLKKYFSNITKVGILFGRENSGLTNKEISLANKIITIDTDKEFTSLNIAHSVSIICYEIFKLKQKDKNFSKNIKLATQFEIENFYTHLFQSIETQGFFKTSEKKEHITQKIRNIFSRIENLSHSELQTLRGIVKILSKEES